MQFFEVLHTPVSRRQRALDEDLARFPHVSRELFAGRLRPPAFDSAMRSALLDAGQFDCTAISPAIFGALFQSVMEPAGRRAQGAHYTTEKNILKVIEPLFLDDLRAEFRRLQARRDGRAVADLRRFPDKLGSLWLVRTRVRLQQLPDHRPPRASDAGDRRAAGDRYQGFRREPTVSH